MLRKSLCGLFCIVGVAVSALAQNSDPAAAKAEFMRWLAGNWRMERNGRMVDEQWMAPAGGVMLGMSRTVAKGKVLEFEYLQLREGPDNRLFYIAIPSRQKETTFTSTSISATAVVFENPEHDFPKKVTYARQSDGSLLATIEGPAKDGSTRRVEFAYKRVEN